MKDSRFRLLFGAVLATVALVLGACGVTGAASDSVTSGSGSSDVANVAAPGSELDSTTVHEIALTVDDAEFEEMVQTYLDSDEKEWVEGSVTTDGQTFDNVGIKLKGNSTLKSITVDTPAEELPLRIRLDKYVDGQEYGGVSDFTVRASSSETSMNEAVALDLLREAGLASTAAIATRFSVNGSDEQLRLTVQNLDETWVAGQFPDAGADSVLYKADADGDWSWLGDDGDYTGSFDVEAGDDNYEPLIELLDLVNNGTADEVAEKLPELLDIDSFATYLAFQDVIDNSDDIDGPGNNSYLFWDSNTGMFTVVAWDHNLAFGYSPNAGGGGGGHGGAGGQASSSADAAEDAADGAAAGRDQGNQGGGRMTQSNPLVTVFTENSEWSALYDTKLADLKSSLLTGGALVDSVEIWTATLQKGASDLVSDETISTEAATIEKYAEG